MDDKTTNDFCLPCGIRPVTAQQAMHNFHMNLIHIIEPRDISFHPLYKKMGENVKPVWFENNHGRQITFLIEDEK